MPGSQASAALVEAEQGSAQVQAALAELEWAQVLESQSEPGSLESVPELDLLAGMDSQAARVAQALGSQGSQVPEWAEQAALVLESARAGPESQERESAEKAASAQERESARQEQQESQAQQAELAHTHARSRHT